MCKIAADFFWCKDRIALKVISSEPPCHYLSKNIWFSYVSFRRTQVINHKKWIVMARPSLLYTYTFLLLNHRDDITCIRITYWHSLAFYRSILQYCLPQKCVFGHITYALIIIVRNSQSETKWCIPELSHSTCNNE